MEIEYPEGISSISQIQKSLADEKLKGLSIQQTGDRRFLLRFGEVDEALHQKILTALSGAKELRFEAIGPIIGEELRKKTIIGLLFAVIGMFLYVGVAFRKVSRGIRSWRMSLSAILALIHDIVITGGGFVILSHYYGFEVGILFVAAELTIWGYSINDTIVVFDRIRENLLREGKGSLTQISGESINQTIGRSINTSGAVLILLLTLLLMGPAPLLPFVVPLIIGVIIGTYSSIFLATPLLLERVS